MVSTTTFGTIAAKIADDLDRNDLSPQINQAINEAIQYYSAYNFRFNNVVEDFSTIDGVGEYTTDNGLPSNIEQIKAVQNYNTATDKYTVDPVAYEVMIELTSSVNAIQGLPTYWSWFDETFYVYPVPNQVLTIRLSFKKTYPKLVLTADNNDFTNNASDLIRARAEQMLSMTVTKNQGDAVLYKAVADDLLKSYRKRFANSQPHIDVTPWGF